MIPSPDKVSGDFFQLSSWPSGGIRPSQAILTQALKVQRQLPTAYSDLVLIAGRAVSPFVGGYGFGRHTNLTR